MKQSLLKWLLYSAVLLLFPFGNTWAQGETCGAAAPIAMGAACVNTPFDMTAFAGTGIAAPACGASNRDGWWSFTTGPTTQSVTINETSTRPHAVALYSACNAGGFMGCGTATANNQATVAVNVSPNTTYYVRVLRTNAGANSWTGNVCVVGSNIALIPGCLTASNGQYPANPAYVPTCNGVANAIATDCWAGEWSRVSVTNGTSYTFSSSVATDFLTISNNGGTTVLASGTGSVVWVADITGNVRFYTHTNAACGEQNVNRDRRVQCGVVQPPPANDNCAGAIPLTPGTTCTPVNGDVSSATQSMAGCTGTADDDVWYSFMATSATHSVSVDGSTVFDAVVEAFSGGCGGLVSLSCTDNTVDDEVEEITLTGLTIGQTYYIRVYDYYSGAPPTTTFTICVTVPPANDNCANAVALNVNPINTCPGLGTAGTTSGATDEGIPEPTCDNFGGFQDVWYSFNSGPNTDLAFNISLGSAQNVGIEFFTACGAPMVGLSSDCDFEAWNAPLPIVSGFTPNTNYRFRIFTNTDFETAGTFNVCISQVPPPPANDNICGSLPLTVGTTTTPSYTAATNVNATDGTQGFGICSFGDFANDVWFTAVVPNTGNVVVAINPGSTLDDLLGEIYTSSNNTCTGLLTSVACNDDDGQDARPFVYAGGLTPGTNVFIRISAYDATDPQGTFGIAVTDAIHWTGTTSTNPTVVTNWLGNPEIVDATTDVRIFNVPNTLTATANFNVLDVYMNDNATVISNGGNFRVNGNLHGGTFGNAANFNAVGNNNVLLLSNTGIVDGYINAQRIRINGSYTITGGSNHLNVSSALITGAAGSLTTNGNVTLLSNISGTAYLDNFTNGGTVTGSINVQRYNPIGVTGYRQLGTPVAMPNISGVNGFTVSGIPGFVIPLPTCDPNYVASNSPYGSWVQLVENAAPQFNCSQSLFQVLTGGGMTNGRGYYMDATGGSTFTFTGTPNTGAVSFGLTHANTAISNGWNMVSNPYPSPLAWEMANVPAGVDAIGKIWVTSGTYTGTFQDIDPSAGGTQSIAIGQAFQVRVSTPGGSVPFAVDNTDRTVTAPTYLFAGNDPMTLNIDILGNGFADMGKVRFIDGATPAMDAMFDSPKMLGNANQPMVYSIWGGKNYSTNSYEELDEVYALPLGVKIATTGQHTLAFSNISEFPSSALIYLEDTENGTVQDIRTNDTYNFTETAGTIDDRFILRFYPPVEKNVTDATCETPGEVVLTEDSPSNWAYVLENAQNTTVSQGTLDVTQTITNLPAGTYTLTLTHQTSGYVAVEMVEITGAQAVLAQAQASVAQVEAGQEVQFTANTQNATSWNWNFGDGNTSTDQNPIHIYNAAGEYQITLVATNGTCEAESQVTVSAYSTASIEDNVTNAGVKMWNDNTTVYIKFEEEWTDKATFTLYDISGKKILQQVLNKANGTQLIDCGILAAGTYTAELSSKAKTVSRKTMMGIK